MSMTRFIIFFAVVGGVFVPLIFKVISLIILVFPSVLMNIMLIVWPSSIMMLAPSSDESFFSEVFLISVAVNIVLYVVIGTAIWYGFFMKYYWILVMLAIMMGYIWWNLLTL